MVPNVNKARMFAGVAHAGQTYADEMPYTEHLEHVVEKLRKFGFDTPAMICAGYLHDVIEDTTKSYNDIMERFGEEVAELVFAVSSELGRNRKERNAKTYPKMAGNAMATVLKLADRIANVDYSLANGGKLEMYRKEYPDFRAALYRTDYFGDQPQAPKVPFDQAKDKDMKDWSTFFQTVTTYNVTGNGKKGLAIKRMWQYLDTIMGFQENGST